MCGFNGTLSLMLPAPVKTAIKFENNFHQKFINGHKKYL